ncbi:hypothetical protein BDB00DRAFT_793765 [Zychaea mexicana]|uniref:uncharacterized protein n=1 Tax=Zychaea mexicana TaxID=64656 RepID=UPI0022FDCC3A|nr:uncharacterized protein BDB00DRAFT_793765 [Zychaea mexicana]KAI9468207.1 hypothetical protein BDB00DRAFT_793765 [Zychaea mexicana]
MTAQEDDASPEAVNAITHQDLFMQQHLQQQIEQIASIANISIDKCPTSEVDPDHERQIIHGNYSDDEIIELITEDMQQISINEESTATESANNPSTNIVNLSAREKATAMLNLFHIFDAEDSLDNDIVAALTALTTLRTKLVQELYSQQSRLTRFFSSSNRN